MSDKQRENTAAQRYPTPLECCVYYCIKHLGSKGANKASLLESGLLPLFLKSKRTDPIMLKRNTVDQHVVLRGGPGLLGGLQGT